MKQWRASLAGLAALAVIAGCSSPTAALDPEPFATITEGRSTRAEVEKLYGPAQGLDTAPNGNVVLSYVAREGNIAYRANGADLNYRLRLVTFLCNSSGMVTRKLFSESWNTIEARRAERMKDGNPLSPAEVARVAQPGVDRADLVKAFGHETWESLLPSGGSLIVWEAELQNYNPGLLGEVKTDKQRVRVTLDPGGKVVHFVIRGLLNGKELGVPTPPVEKPKSKPATL